MKRRLEYTILGGLAVLSGYSIIVRFLNPELTDTQLSLCLFGVCP